MLSSALDDGVGTIDHCTSKSVASDPLTQTSRASSQQASQFKRGSTSRTSRDTVSSALYLSIVKLIVIKSDQGAPPSIQAA